MVDSRGDITTMRYLHAIAPHEDLISRGTYRYYDAEGVPTGLVEYWAVHEQPDGSQIIRVDKDGRSYDGRTELIEAWRSRTVDGAKIERFDVSYYGALDESPRRMNATYVVEGSELYVGRTVGNEQRLQSSIELPETYGVQPGAYIFFGYLIPSIVEHAPLAVVMRYGVQPQVESSFAVTLTYPSLAQATNETIQVDGKSVEARCYIAGESRVVSETERKVERHRYYIDRHDVFLGHKSDSFSVQLESYVRPRTPPS